MPLHPTRWRFFLDVWSRARKLENRRWLYKAFEVAIWIVASAVPGVMTGVWAGVIAGVITGCIGLLALFLCRVAFFIFTAAYAVHCEQLDKIGDVESDRKAAIASHQFLQQSVAEKPASAYDVADTMYRLSAALPRIAKSPNATINDLKVWRDSAKTFVRIAFRQQDIDGFGKSSNSRPLNESSVTKAESHFSAYAGWLTNVMHQLAEDPGRVRTELTLKSLRDWESANSQVLRGKIDRDKPTADDH